MDGSTRHFWPLSVTEQFLSTNAAKDERPCTRVGATAGRKGHVRVDRRDILDSRMRDVEVAERVKLAARLRVERELP